MRSGKEKVHLGFSLSAIIPPVPPLNLAIFRIALFLTLIRMVFRFNPVWFTRLPPELLLPPQGLHWAAAHLPCSAAVMSWLMMFFITACLFAVAGFHTRLAAFAAALLGTFVLGYPQLYGKVNHFQHLIWFAFLIAASPAPPALSLDAAREAMRRADCGDLSARPLSQAAGLTAFFVLLLIGVLYFFPGFWKMARGADWFWSDNIKWQLYHKWAEIPDVNPLFRIDRYWPLYKATGLGTVLFELLFFTVIFFPAMRPVYGMAGLAFHNSIGGIMRIPFFPLQSCYVIFFDWEKGFRRLGVFLFKERMTLIYDAQCKLCRRAIACLRVIDLLGQIDYVGNTDREGLRRHKADFLPEEDLNRDIHALSGQKVWKGYDAYRALAWRMPFLWPSLPLLYLSPVAAAGKAIYRRVADSRTCEMPMKASSPAVPTDQGFEEGRGRSLLVATGIFLVVMNTVFGVLKINSWPFSVYPTFSSMFSGETRSILTIEAWDADGAPLPYSETIMKRRFGQSRWHVLKELTFKRKAHSPEQERHLEALGRVLLAENPELQRAAVIRFSRQIVSGNPDHRKDNPLETEVLYQMPGPAAPAGFGT